LLAGVALLLAGCGGFRYEKLSSEPRPATREVAWLTAEPARPHTMIARFRGAEVSLCPLSRPYCSLYDEAMKEGADAIWVQRRQVSTSGEQWVMIQGQMRRIPPVQSERLEGVLIRYR
jgi:hypothetical protein